MTTVDFMFVLGERIKTLFGDDGIITMCAIDDGGKVYYVKTSKDSGWFKEDQITKG